ncbi:baseplate hub subunit and tail lysozyme [Serratia phage PS2]|uniref:Pre-baseplate central spike protein n=1 Tax=Serratia phage PS2 TaxID=1481112 RepID=A0A023W6M9_9CAUD|nr:baseplate hub subunit and tail lysozyme [Serratia phage PS2]AHY25407.1 baseplate hub subunit and tail lysozyme [Serratia phage PS2]
MNVQHNEMKWFAGVVESRDDPLKAGRVKVRVFGEHPFVNVPGDIQGLTTEQLPWMQPVQDITSAAISGVGQSPTGILPGSHVFGVWLDKFKTSGMVLGTVAGIYSKMPNFNEGFADPSGQYPRYVGNDVNVLAGGGQAGKDALTVEQRSTSQGIAVNPDEGPAEDIPEDDNPEGFTLQKMLIFDEGYKRKVYWDTEGYPTIGVGHLIVHERTKDMGRINKLLSQQVGREVTNGIITAEEVTTLFDKDTNIQLVNMSKYPNIMAAYNAAEDNTPRKWALINMSFNLGAAGLAGFTTSLGLMAQKKWEEASVQLKNSKWFRQVKGRGPRICNTIRFGNLESYGVKAPRPEGKSLSAAIARAMGNDPQDPWTPEDSRIMFKEPISSYDAQYPYNKVMESESGHIIEIDDTPSNERMHWRHTSGTYEEWRPDGTSSRKSVSDSYDIVSGERNILSEANENHVVGASLKEYVMGDLTIQTDGQHVMIVRGASVVRVEGNSTVIVDGDSTVNVKGNANIKVEGNCDQTIQGDYSLKVAGNYSVSVEGMRVDTVQGSWDRTTTGGVQDISSSTFFIDGSRIDFG